MTIFPLWARVIAVITAVALIGIAVHRLDMSRQEIGYQRGVAEYNVKLLAAQADARAQEIAWQTKQKQEQEKTNEQLLARDRQYQSSLNTIGGLRNTIADLSNGVSTITAAACSARIAALSAVSNECADALAAMAGHAEGQRIDSMSCRELWPNYPPK